VEQEGARAAVVRVKLQYMKDKLGRTAEQEIRRVLGAKRY